MREKSQVIVLKLKAKNYIIIETNISESPTDVRDSHAFYKKFLLYAYITHVSSNLLTYYSRKITVCV